MKTKSKIHTDIKNLVLAKAHQYTRPVQKAESSEEEDDPADLLQIAAEKERKKEKMRLKKQRKKEAREKSVKKDVSEARKLAIDYLHSWNSSRETWTFKKNLQTWLLKNIFSTEDNNKEQGGNAIFVKIMMVIKMIEEKDFEILLNYVIDLKGQARSRLSDECENVIKSFEEKTEEDMKRRECVIDVLHIFQDLRN
ncbi:cholesin isoform X2 [Parasteatoda tepidariorum]|uniref:cholesin isoform X2 n=1 Tax=Parasteatoda tepidariorum TaxID=114398 RepID=UPI001C71DC11|nr:uncharacterized protein C7orf50 homolog isoform X2 [Parasteatoda tepidariorum]